MGLYLAGQDAPLSGLQGIHAMAILQWPGLAVPFSEGQRHFCA